MRGAHLLYDVISQCTGRATFIKIFGGTCLNMPENAEGVDESGILHPRCMHVIWVVQARYVYVACLVLALFRHHN